MRVRTRIMSSMANVLKPAKRAAIVSALVEGNSIRATARMVGVSKDTVMKLLVDLGRACAEYQDRTFRNLTCRRLQCDEIWSFCYAKQKNIPAWDRGHFGVGDVWTWTAIDADTKLIPSWLVGERTARYAHLFMQDLASRLLHRVQLTTDGHPPYLTAVEDSFGHEIDYAMLVKVYGPDPNDGTTVRYSPARIKGATREVIEGNPDPAHISTSYAERANLTMRMGMRRFTRLTNAFSKKVENHAAAVALHFAHYNFVRIHQSLHVTPAMAAGIADHPWEIEEIVGLL
jgi:IS1 family transposase